MVIKLQNSDVKKTIPEPLMFIHTVSTPIITNGSRKYYDSREKHSTTNKRDEKHIQQVNNIEKDNVDKLLMSKIKNIVQMYNISNPILCIVETSKNESIEGTPFLLEDEFLHIKNDITTRKILLTDINDIIILKV